MNKSDIIILDNPTTNFDNKKKEDFIELGDIKKTFRKKQHFEPSVSFKKKERGSFIVKGNGNFF